jgi:signal transduction histidine kinase
MQWVGRIKKGLTVFRQLLIAFGILTLLLGFSVYITSRVAFRRLERALREHRSPLTELWLDRLGAYYRQTGSWEEISLMVASYPIGEAWAPWGEGWDMQPTVADRDYVILISPLTHWIGKTLPTSVRQWAAPIRSDNQTVGYLLLPFLSDSGPPPPPDGKSTPPRLAILNRVLRQFLLAEAGIIAVGLLLSLVFSQRISHPVSALTDATHSIAEGDLSVRVPENYVGEVGTLATSFNRMAEELERADELRRNLTADVAHELRTPLSVIRGKLEGVLDGIYPATDAHLEPVLEEAELLTHLVEDLRVLTLAENGQLSLERRPMDITNLLRDAQVNFAPHAEDRGITLVLDLPEDLPNIQGDWRRIAQILGNLLTNALRHTPRGGFVTLSARTEESAIGISIRDTGSGIPEEDLPFVFERFWRGEKSRTRKSGGSGLGLAIAKQIVELHGGTIHVESVMGSGTTFRFKLPTDSPSV